MVVFEVNLLQGATECLWLSEREGTLDHVRQGQLNYSYIVGDYFPAVQQKIRLREVRKSSLLTGRDKELTLGGADAWRS